MAYFELDIADMQEPALGVLRTALTHARKNRETRTHVVPLKDFYLEAGFPEEVDRHEFMGHITDVMRVAVFSRDYQPGGFRGWPAFESIAVTETHFEFSACDFALCASEFT